jgi:pimeloyl-ACP methyl ester carboxylesterase
MHNTFTLLIGASESRRVHPYCSFRTSEPEWTTGIRSSQTVSGPTGRSSYSTTPGVAASTGQTPDTIEAMSDDASALIAALDLGQIDVLGFSIGGCVAQAFAMRHPEQVRRLVLVGTTPGAGEMADRDPDASSVVGHPELTMEDYLFLFFERSATSQAAGRDFWRRRHQRTVNVDPPSSAQTAQAQRAALMEWNTPRG